MLRRRDLLKSTLLAAPLWNSFVHRADAAESAVQPAGASRGFDYATLKGRARALAGRAYKAPTNLAPKQLENLSYDQYQAIRFQRERALWFNENRGFRLEFFHLGRGFKEPVRMFELVNGREQEILYKPGLFDLQRTGVNARARQPLNVALVLESPRCVAHGNRAPERLQ